MKDAESTAGAAGALIAGRMLGRLEFVYGPERARPILARIQALLERYRKLIPSGVSGWETGDALLITYADSVLGGNPPLRELLTFLRNRVGRSISYVHLLPFYPYTSDDGFAVTDFREVRADLGTWDDIKEFSREYKTVFDGVINHVSASSVYMQKYCAGDPACADYFIDLDPATDTSSVLRTRNLPLLHDYDTAAGKKWLWTTFSRDQVDLNYSNPEVLLEVIDVLLGYAAQGAAMIRLDAIPYMWKQLGTSCAHLRQVHELIKLFRDVFDLVAPHVKILTETNVPHHENVVYFGDRGDEAQLIYNFSLAPLILWSLVRGDATVLTAWSGKIEYISERATYLNITATHDGIGMRPTEGILTEQNRAELMDRARRHGGDWTGKRNSDGSVSVYELNISYFDALNDPKGGEPIELQLRRFLVSQAIPVCMMGIPGIYLHSLLGSRNDYAGVARTGRARSINREQLDRGRVEAELADPSTLRGRVFAAVKGMLDIRAGQSAFHPDAGQQILDWGPSLFVVCRHSGKTGERILAVHNMTGTEVTHAAPHEALTENAHDILAGEHFCAQPLTLAPYQVRWIKSSDSPVLSVG